MEHRSVIHRSYNNKLPLSALTPLGKALVLAGSSIIATIGYLIIK